MSFRQIKFFLYYFVIILLGVDIFTSFVYDAQHLIDNIFAAEIGWRVLNGATPTVDFGHHDGGLFASDIALAFELFGGDIRPPVYAAALMAATALFAGLLVAFRRLDRVTTLLMVIAISVLCLARAPIETTIAIIEPISAHSFVYYRFAFALMLVTVLYCMTPARVAVAEAAGGIAVGALLVMRMPLKPSFAIAAPAAAAALFAQRRRVGAVAVVAGFFLAMLILDPLFAKIAESYRYASASVGHRISLFALLWKVLRMALGEPLALVALLGALGMALADARAYRMAMLASATALGGATLAMALTMGGPGSIGHLFLVVATVLAVGLTARATWSASRFAAQVRWVAVALVVATTAPQALNLLSSAALGYVNRDRTLFAGGPLEGYFTRPPDGPDAYRGVGAGTDRRARLAERVAALSAQGEFEPKAGQRDIALADAIAAHEEIPDVADHAILADDRLSFSFALGAPPVVAYPVWQWDTSPEFRDPEALSEAIDIAPVIVHADDPGPLATLAETRLSHCADTALWRIHVRPGLELPICQTRLGG